MAVSGEMLPPSTENLTGRSGMMWFKRYVLELALMWFKPALISLLETYSNVIITQSFSVSVPRNLKILSDEGF